MDADGLSFLVAMLPSWLRTPGFACVLTFGPLVVGASAQKALLVADIKKGPKSGAPMWITRFSTGRDQLRPARRSGWLWHPKAAGRADPGDAQAAGPVDRLAGHATLF